MQRTSELGEMQYLAEIAVFPAIFNVDKELLPPILTKFAPSAFLEDRLILGS